MTPSERNYAALILLWSRTVEEHGLTFDAWIARRHMRGGDSRPNVTTHKAA